VLSAASNCLPAPRPAARKRRVEFHGKFLVESRHALNSGAERLGPEWRGEQVWDPTTHVPTGEGQPLTMDGGKIVGYDT
jgi:hypothetical protein